MLALTSLNIDKTCSEQLTSVDARTSIPAEQQAIIHGIFQLAASLLAPMLFTKFHKKTAFIICGTLAALSPAAGTSYYINLNYFLRSTKTNYFQLQYLIILQLCCQASQEII